MIRRLYKKYIRKNFIFQPDPNFSYILPKNIQGPRKIINLELSRIDQLLRPPSRYEEWFREDIWSSRLCKFLIDFIQEFPIPIISRDDWIKCCQEEGLIYGEEINRRYFLADYFLPRTGRIIEIDGEQHRQQVEYDRARDKYIFQTYGIRTIRLPEYRSYRWFLSGKTLGDCVLKEEFDIFPSRSQYPLDFTEFIYNCFEEIYHDFILILEDIVIKYPIENVKLIEIEKGDFIKLANGLGKSIFTYQYKQFSKFLYSITKQKIRIINR